MHNIAVNHAANQHTYQLVDKNAPRGLGCSGECKTRLKKSLELQLNLCIKSRNKRLNMTGSKWLSVKKEHICVACYRCQSSVAGEVLNCYVHEQSMVSLCLLWDQIQHTVTTFPLTRQSQILNCRIVRWCCRLDSVTWLVYNKDA